MTPWVMIIRALAPWLGGKRTLAPCIVSELGEHTQYFEPFGGGLSVLLEKPTSQKETVNDLHGDLTNLARVLQRIGLAEQLYDRLCRVNVCEGILRDAQQVLEAGKPEVDSVDVDRAYWYFLASWMGRNGTAGTDRIDYQIAVRWTKNGGSPTVRFANAVQSIPAWHQRLLNVVILQRDAFKIMHKFEDCEGTAIYLDPPYPPEMRTGYDAGKGGNSRYEHELDHHAPGLFAENAVGDENSQTHERIAEIARAYKRARVVVSTYDCERYRRLYDGWTFIDKKMIKRLYAQSARVDREPVEDEETEFNMAPELLIVNGPAYALHPPARKPKRNQRRRVEASLNIIENACSALVAKCPETPSETPK